MLHEKVWARVFVHACASLPRIAIILVNSGLTLRGILGNSQLELMNGGGGQRNENTGTGTNSTLSFLN